MNKHRTAFTLIEILISVLIISTSIVYILKIYSQNHEQIIYISGRNKQALEDSLFLTDRVLNYNKEEKSAYDILNETFLIDDFQSKNLLKTQKRKIIIPEPIRLSADEEESNSEGMPAALIHEVTLKNNYTSSYFHFELQSF